MVSGWKTENRLTLWPQLLTSEPCSCRCTLFGLVCQVKIAVLPTVVRVSSFRRGSRNSKLFALCRCIEILLKFTDFPWCFSPCFYHCPESKQGGEGWHTKCALSYQAKGCLPEPSWSSGAPGRTWEQIQRNRKATFSPPNFIIHLNEIVGPVPTSYRAGALFHREQREARENLGHNPIPPSARAGTPDHHFVLQFSFLSLRPHQSIWGLISYC